MKKKRWKKVRWKVLRKPTQKRRSRRSLEEMLEAKVEVGKVKVEVEKGEEKDIKDLQDLSWPLVGV